MRCSRKAVAVGPRKLHMNESGGMRVWKKCEVVLRLDHMSDIEETDGVADVVMAGNYASKSF